MGLVLSCLLLLWASELFTDNRGGGVHEVYCFRRGEIAFFRGDHQIYRSRVGDADKVGVRFRVIERREGKRGAIFGRKVNPAHRERGALESQVELTRTQGGERVPLSLPLMAFRFRKVVGVGVRGGKQSSI